MNTKPIKTKAMKTEYEILILAIANIWTAVLMFSFIHNRCLSRRKTMIFFALPLWLLFTGFYYIRCFIDETFEGQYWRLFRLFSMVTGILFTIFIYIINKKHKQ